MEIEPVSSTTGVPCNFACNNVCTLAHPEPTPVEQLEIISELSERPHAVCFQKFSEKLKQIINRHTYHTDYAHLAFYKKIINTYIILAEQFIICLRLHSKLPLLECIQCNKLFFIEIFRMLEELYLKSSSAILDIQNFNHFMILTWIECPECSSNVRRLHNN